MDLKAGDVVWYGEGLAIVRYCGKTDFSEGDSMLGLELGNDTGVHNGTVNGVEYFSCAENRGVFINSSEISKQLYADELLKKLAAVENKHQEKLRLINEAISRMELENRNMKEQLDPNIDLSEVVIEVQDSDAIIEAEKQREYDMSIQLIFDKLSLYKTFNYLIKEHPTLTATYSELAQNLYDSDGQSIIDLEILRKNIPTQEVADKLCKKLKIQKEINRPMPEDIQEEWFNTSDEIRFSITDSQRRKSLIDEEIRRLREELLGTAGSFESSISMKKAPSMVDKFKETPVDGAIKRKSPASILIGGSALPIGLFSPRPGNQTPEENKEGAV